MNRNRIVAVTVISLITCHLSLITSCSSINCPVENTVAMHYAILNSDGTEGQPVDTLWVWTQRSDGTDTLVLNSLTGTSTFSLPVSYSHPEDVLVFYMADRLGIETLDTVWIKKDDIPHFESVDCAAHFFHHITDVRCTHEGIDSIVINNRTVDYNSTVTHLNIYFTPSGINEN